MTWMFNDNFKVNNDSFAALGNSDFSNDRDRKFSLNTHVKVVFVLEMTCASIVHACKVVQHNCVNMSSLSDISL